MNYPEKLFYFNVAVATYFILKLPEEGKDRFGFSLEERQFTCQDISKYKDIKQIIVLVNTRNNIINYILT